jgi:hypothetical protein
METRRYTLYRARTSGYARFVELAGRSSADSQPALHVEFRNWMRRPDAVAGRYKRYDYPTPARAAPAMLPRADCSDRGRIEERRVGPSSLELLVECPLPSTVVAKMTYHPKWRATVDGLPTPLFMVSGGLAGLDVPAGRHEVTLEYRTGPLHLALMVLGASAVVATVALGRRFRSVSWPSPAPPG